MDISALAPLRNELLRAICRVACLIAVLPVASPTATPVQQGLTGSWYQPRTKGEGVVLQVYSNAVAPGVAYLHGTWLTFYRPGYWDYGFDSGPSAQRWYTFGGGTPEDATDATFALYANSGGNFLAPPATSATPVGTVTLNFVDCATVVMDYHLDDQSGSTGDPTSGTIGLTRLAPNVTCAESGTRPADTDFAHSGHWHEATLAGQGLFVELNPAAGLMLLAWPTYAPVTDASEGVRTRWYTGQGPYLAGSRTIPLTLYQTTGGLRDGGGGVTAAVGLATLTFSSCESASLTFAFGGGSSAGAGGTVHLTRLGPTPTGCAP